MSESNAQVSNKYKQILHITPSIFLNYTDDAKIILNSIKGRLPLADAQMDHNTIMLVIEIAKSIQQQEINDKKMELLNAKINDKGS